MGRRKNILCPSHYKWDGTDYGVYHLANRYLLQNMDWFEEELGEYEDDYLIIDCPGTPCYTPLLVILLPISRSGLIYDALLYL